MLACVESNRQRTRQSEVLVLGSWSAVAVPHLHAVTRFIAYVPAATRAARPR
jgi:hypothetical protein